MGSKKRRIIRKRIQKRIQKRKEKSKHDKETNDKVKQAVGGEMSKFEYQQNLLDPRFRAAMVGLGSFPITQSGMANANQYLQEHREKNNELSRKLALEQDMAKLKQENSSLKLQYQIQKVQHADDYRKFQEEQKKKYLEDVNRRQQQLYDEKMKYEKEMSALKAQNQSLKAQEDDQKRREQQAEAIFKNQEEIKGLLSKIDIANINGENSPLIKDLKSTLSTLIQNQDELKAGFANQEEIKGLLSKIDIANIDSESGKLIQDLKAKLSTLLQNQDTIKAGFANQQEILKTKHQVKMAEDQSDFNDQHHPLVQKLNELQRNQEKINKAFENQEKLLDKQKELFIAQYNEATGKQTRELEDRINTLKRQEEIIKLQIAKVDEYQALVQQLKTLQIQSQADLKNHNLKEDIADLRRTIELNEKEFHKQNEYFDLMVEREKLRQEADPDTREEAHERVMELETGNEIVRRGNKLLKKVSNNLDEVEAVEIETVQYGAKVFGEEFKPDEIYQKDFPDKVKQFLVKSQQKLQKVQATKAELQKLWETREQARKVKEENEQQKYKLDEQTAKHQAIEEAQRIKKLQEIKAKTLQEELDRKDEHLENLHEANSKKTRTASAKFNELMEEDAEFRNAAYAVAEAKGEEVPSFTMLDDIMAYMEDQGGKTIHTGKLLNQISSYQAEREVILTQKQTLEQYAQTLAAENAELKKTQENKQKQLNQSARFAYHVSKYVNDSSLNEYLRFAGFNDEEIQDIKSEFPKFEQEQQEEQEQGRPASPPLWVPK